MILTTLVLSMLGNIILINTEISIVSLQIIEEELAQ